MLLPTLPTTPYAVTDDTFVIPTIAAAPDGTFVSANSLVIRGAEPVIVDTGCALVRDDWAERAFSVVEPDDVRWVVITHDDHDHIGQPRPRARRCPNATLVVNYLVVAGRRRRRAADRPDALKNEGDALTLADRTLQFVRPPLFDSPSTRAVFDTSNGVMWGADSFAAPLPGEVYEIGDVPVAMLDEQFPLHNQWNTPWLAVGRHGEVRRAPAGHRVAPGRRVGERARPGVPRRADRRRVRPHPRLVGAPMPELPGQDVLEPIAAVLGAPAQ